MASLKSVLESGDVGNQLESAMNALMARMVALGETLNSALARIEELNTEAGREVPKARVGEESVRMADVLGWSYSFKVLRPFVVDTYRSVLERHILMKLSPPIPLTLDDLASAFENSYLSEVRREGRDACLTAFRRQVTGMVDRRQCGEPFQVFTGYYFWDEPELVVWRGEHSSEISIVGALATGSGFSVLLYKPECAHRSVYAVFRGICSQSALVNTVEEVRMLLKTLFNTCEQLQRPEPPPHVHALITDGVLRGQFRLIPRCLDAFYGESTKKDSIDRRVKNAITLLVEADRQSNHAIGLSLCVSAVEALVGTNQSELSSLIADNVATLLEPDPGHRAKAVAYAKKLYDLRSKALHGTIIEAELDRREEARLLASGVLKAMIERRDTLRGMGYDPETPQDLLGEIKRAKFGTGLPAGVTESPVRTLWGAVTWQQLQDEAEKSED